MLENRLGAESRTATALHGDTLFAESLLDRAVAEAANAATGFTNSADRATYDAVRDGWAERRDAVRAARGKPAIGPDAVIARPMPDDEP